MPRYRASGALLLGGCAGGLTLAISLLLRAVTGLPSLSEVLGNGIALALPGSVFGSLIDTFQEKGRPLLLLGASALVLVLGAAMGLAMARWSWLAVAPHPAAPAVRRGRAVRRWLAPALGLWVLSLPLVALGQGSLAVPGAWSSLAEWLLLAGLVELLLGLPLRGGASPSVLRSGTPGVSTRRDFLAATGALVGAASLGYLGWNVLRASSPAVTRLNLGSGAAATRGGLPDGITSVSEFYVVSKDLFGPPSVDVASWRLRVLGPNPFSLSYPELLALPHRSQTQTLECISNPVGGTLISTGVWRGVQLAELLRRAGVSDRAQRITFSCADGYTESLPLAQAMAPTTLVAYRLNGRRLTSSHGFPARILVVDHYGMKNPKWLTGIAPDDRPFVGYWEQQGWDAGAFPRVFSRFDFPSGNSLLSAGRQYLLTGVAYAGTRGISAVELSLDQSRHWSRAKLELPLSPYSWTLWSFPWRPSSGFYTLTVRARDGRGDYQHPNDDQTFPSGASGYQQLTVLAR